LKSTTIELIFVIILSPLFLITQAKLGPINTINEVDTAVAIATVVSDVTPAARSEASAALVAPMAADDPASDASHPIGSVSDGPDDLATSDDSVGIADDQNRDVKDSGNRRGAAGTSRVNSP
jgi:hypothetical protein